MHGPLKRIRSVCIATFPDLYVMRWMSCFLEHVFPRIGMNARAFSRVSRSLAV